METKIWNIVSAFMENVSNTVPIYISLFGMNPLYMNCCTVSSKIYALWSQTIKFCDLIYRDRYTCNKKKITLFFFTICHSTATHFAHLYNSCTEQSMKASRVTVFNAAVTFFWMSLMFLKSSSFEGSFHCRK
jgi:hypothetical protein